MPEDVEDYVAKEFHGLVSDLQRNDVVRFEEERKKQAELRAALRRTSGQGMSAGDLLRRLDGDPADADRKVQAELDRVDKDAKAAVDKSQSKAAPLPEGHFPPPPECE